MLTPLRDATEAGRFGGKAASLAALLRAGFAAPDGVALDPDAALAVAGGAPLDVEALPPRPLAVRSSAIGEDAVGASFAGQHKTLLGVDRQGATDAVREVVASAAASAGYRARLGLPPARMAVVIQTVIAAEVAGVLFTRHPVTGAETLLLEAGYGLGEAVVAGLITPDQWELTREGVVLAHRAGSRDLKIVLQGRGTVEAEVPPHLQGRPPLTAADLSAVVALIPRLDRTFADGAAHDVEFAFAGGELFVLQRRPITR